MVSLMYSDITVATYAVLNYNLDYNSSVVLSRAIASRGFCYETLVRFYAETCWVHCYTKSVTHQGRSGRFVPADSAGPVILHAKFRTIHKYTFEWNKQQITLLVW